MDLARRASGSRDGGRDLCSVGLLGKQSPYEHSSDPLPEDRHEQLFDLERDPLELGKLAADPAHAETKARLRARMEEQHAPLGDPHALAVETLSPKEFDYCSVEHQPDAHQPARVIEKCFRDVSSAKGE